MYSSPTTPTGAGRSAASRTYIWVFHTGRPMVTTPAGTASPGSMRYSVHPIVVSVGPYSLTTVVVGLLRRHSASTSPISDSPPSTSCSDGENAAGRAISGVRWLGVALTNVGRTRSVAVAADSSSSTNWTRPPAVSGANRPVAVRSNETGEGTSARPATPGYAARAQAR